MTTMSSEIFRYFIACKTIVAAGTTKIRIGRRKSFRWICFMAVESITTSSTTTDKSYFNGAVFRCDPQPSFFDIALVHGPKRDNVTPRAPAVDGIVVTRPCVQLLV